MIAWIDASVGCSGDMLLAALLDAGARVEVVREGLRTLGLAGWSLETQEVRRGSFRALRASVRVDGQESDPDHDHPHPHHHDHPHPHHHDHSHPHHHDHPHRPWRDIRALLERAPIPERARGRALAAYGRLAEAEAHLHGLPVDDVELHEVGATDAVIDIVGVCLALEDLDIDTLVATPLPMGEGHVHGAHGRIPLPAPATLALVKDWPIEPGRRGEWVTPTGAALVTTLARPGGPPGMIPERVGHGAGRRNPAEVANLVRVLVGRVAGATHGDTVIELACNLDDLTGELVAPVMSGLLDAGALDAWITPILMKKGRPAFTLHALARPADADALSERLLRETTTLGVRRSAWSRDTLDRWTEDAATPWGRVRVKIGGREGRAWHAAPELDDVLARARAGGVPAQQVYQAAIAAWCYGDRGGSQD